MEKEIFDYVVNTSKAEERRRLEEAWAADKKGYPYTQFFADLKAKDLIEPCAKLTKHHRGRQEHYTKLLEGAEKVLRETGLSMEAVDPRTGFSFVEGASLCSGAMYNPTQPSYLPKFQAKVNQELLGDVERAKTKMIDHGTKADQYEKLARAFKTNPEFVVRLSTEDIHFFRLGQ